MSIVGEDELETISALVHLLRKTEDRLLFLRGFHLKDEAFIRGDHTISRDMALKTVATEIAAEKADYYIRHVIPGLLADSQIPKGFFSAPFNEDKALKAATKLLPEKPEKKKTNFMWTSARKKILEAGKELGQFTTAEMVSKTELPRSVVGPILSSFKARGLISVDGSRLAETGHQVNIWKFTNKEENGKPRAEIGYWSGKFWDGSISAKLLTWAKNTSFFTVRDAAAALGSNTNNVSSVVSKLVRSGYLREVNRGKCGARTLGITDKPYEIVPPIKGAFVSAS